MAKIAAFFLGLSSVSGAQLRSESAVKVTEDPCVTDANCTGSSICVNVR